jgi:hypothetical protein
MSDTVDDAAWPPQPNNPSLVGQRRRVRSPGERFGSGVAAAPIPTLVKAGSHV